MSIRKQTGTVSRKAVVNKPPKSAKPKVAPAGQNPKSGARISKKKS
jgi:hypothetical protein